MCVGDSSPSHTPPLTSTHLWGHCSCVEAHAAAVADLLARSRMGASDSSCREGGGGVVLGVIILSGFVKGVTTYLY